MPATGFDLARFVSAQAPVIADVFAELEAGRKRSHWMWFVFPQLRGLGHSAMARHYGITSVAEARAYLAHDVLGPRLHACCEVLLGLPATSAMEVFGMPDDLKLKSCMTLFAAAASSGEDKAPFEQVLRRFYDGDRDARTLAMLV
ncbi:MAG: calpastatin [Rhodoferax sp.]|nr:calpastatin [Rhodoferax sp.]